MVNATAMNGVVENASNLATKIAVAITILLGGFALGILAKKFLYKILKEIELNRIMRKVGIALDLEKWISSIVSYVIYLATIVIFLDKLGLKSVVLYIVVGAVLMLIILTFLVGLKDVIPNIVAWVLIQRKGKIKEGHHINVREISGRVEKIGYLETEIRTHDGDTLYVPNNLFMKSKFKVKK